jgi:hypothetical protein
MKLVKCEGFKSSRTGLQGEFHCLFYRRQISFRVCMSSVWRVVRYIFNVQILRRRAVDILRRAADIFRRAVDIFRRAVDIFRRAVDIFRRAVDIFRRAVDIFRRAVDIFRKL